MVALIHVVELRVPWDSLGEVEPQLDYFWDGSYVEGPVVID